MASPSSVNQPSPTPTPTPIPTSTPTPTRTSTSTSTPTPSRSRSRSRSPSPSPSQELVYTTAGVWTDDGKEGLDFISLQQSFFPPLEVDIELSAISIEASSKGLVLYRDAEFGKYFIRTSEGSTVNNVFSLIVPDVVLDPKYSAHHHGIIRNGQLTEVIVVPDNGESNFVFYTQSVGSRTWRKSHRFYYESSHLTITPRSSVSCAGKVFWMVESPWAMALAYDPTHDQSWLVPSPEGHLEKHCVQWSLGCTSYSMVWVIVKQETIVCYSRSASSIDDFSWRLEGSLNFEVDAEGPTWDMTNLYPIRCRTFPRVLACQSSKMELILWVDGRMIVLEEMVNGGADERPVNWMEPRKSWMNVAASHEEAFKLPVVTRRMMELAVGNDSEELELASMGE